MILCTVLSPVNTEVDVRDRTVVAHECHTQKLRNCDLLSVCSEKIKTLIENILSSPRYVSGGRLSVLILYTVLSPVNTELDVRYRTVVAHKCHRQKLKNRDLLSVFPGQRYVTKSTVIL